MAKKSRFRGARHTPKRLESDILDRAKDIWTNPGILRPKCAGNCRKCVFDKTFALISRLDNIKDDYKALEKAATKGGDDIFKACAGTMSLYAAGGIPYLASARIAGEVVPFAIRGTVGNDKLIGTQYYNDPKMRLLLYGNVARKNKLHLYSFDDQLVCSNIPNMPEDYLLDTFWESPYEFPDDGLSCGHDIEGILVIKIKSLNQDIRICRNCAKEVATLQYVISRLMTADPMDDIEVYVEHKYSKDNKGGKDTVQGDLLKQYMLGQVTDKMLISVVLKDKLNELKKHDVATYIIGSKNYGSDLEVFLGELKGTDLEKHALRSFLKDNAIPVVVRTDRASEALGIIWENNYKKIIASFTNQGIADKIGDVSKMNPSQTISNANIQFLSEDIVSKLPVFNKPGTVTKATDRFAKASKVGGESLLRKEIDATGIKDYKSRSIARAFIMALSSNESAGWKFSAEEEDFAKYLMPFVKQLIEAEGEQYRDAMNTLLTASGSGESV